MTVFHTPHPLPMSLPTPSLALVFFSWATIIGPFFFSLKKLFHCEKAHIQRKYIKVSVPLNKPLCNHYLGESGGPPPTPRSSSGPSRSPSPNQVPPHQTFMVTILAWLFSSASYICIPCMMFRFYLVLDLIDWNLPQAP